MTNEEKTIALKYLALAKDGTRKLWDEYHQIVGSLPIKEQYKLVEKYHKKVRQLINKLSKLGLDEIARLRGNHAGIL